MSKREESIVRPKFTDGQLRDISLKLQLALKRVSFHPSDTFVTDEDLFHVFNCEGSSLIRDIVRMLHDRVNEASKLKKFNIEVGNTNVQLFLFPVSSALTQGELIEEYKRRGFKPAARTALLQLQEQITYSHPDLKYATYWKDGSGFRRVIFCGNHMDDLKRCPDTKEALGDSKYSFESDVHFAAEIA